MTVATLAEVLQPALHDGYAVAGLVCLGWEESRAYVEAAEAEAAPAILMVGPGARGHMPLQVWGPMLRHLAEQASVPICVHLDHGYSLEECRVALEAGFSSLMYDGSRLSLDENIARTREVTELAHGAGISCEGEIGFVGYPNAGKSTLLAALSRARPKIADYPFTTLKPHIGIIEHDDYTRTTICDIPGLIEGASEGVGLGHEFLRHVERTRVFVHLVEPTPMDGTDPIENYQNIREELLLYDAELSKRSELIVVTKCELPDAAAVAELLAEDTGRSVMQISAVTGKGLPDLTQAILKMLGDVDSADDWEPPETRSYE